MSPNSMERLVFLACLSLVAAHAASLPEFEVATVKQSQPPTGNTIQINLGRVLNGQLTLGNASLSDCLKFAYGIVSSDQIVAPDWVTSNSVRFDIVAQAPAGTPRDQIDSMLQALLAERLKLALHHEKKTLPHLALAPGKASPKLGAATSSTGGNLASGGRITATHMSMQALAMLISRFEQQIVVDETGLSGEFEFRLEWTPSSAAVSDTAPGPSIFTAVQEQLGLRLESRKGPLDVLVVDHAEKVPTEN